MGVLYRALLDAVLEMSYDFHEGFNQLAAETDGTEKEFNERAGQLWFNQHQILQPLIDACIRADDDAAAVNAASALRAACQTAYDAIMQ